MYLIMDTSTKYAGVALYQQDKLVKAICWKSLQNHTVELTPAIDSVLGSSWTLPTDLQGIGVALGPGGFSALRAGLGAAKGLAFALGIPLVGVSTLAAEVHLYQPMAHRVCALLPAGRGMVSWGLYEKKKIGWSCRKRQTGPVNDLVKSIVGPTLFCGEAAFEHADELVHLLGSRAIVSSTFSPTTRLTGLACLAIDRLANHDTDSLASLQPEYLRAPSVTLPRPAPKLRRAVVGDK
jgi:tRNA threonylcarbamoyladenosine biosynthesis protein TsaB